MYTGAVADTDNSTFKYRASMQDQTTWLIYITRSDPAYEVHRCDLDSAGIAINCHSEFNGIIQVAKIVARVRLKLGDGLRQLCWHLPF